MHMLCGACSRNLDLCSKISHHTQFDRIKFLFLTVTEHDRMLMSIFIQTTMLMSIFIQTMQINRLLLEDDTGTVKNSSSASSVSEYQSVVREFRAFLSDSKDVLDEATTMRLLERYNNSILRVSGSFFLRLHVTFVLYGNHLISDSSVFTICIYNNWTQFANTWRSWRSVPSTPIIHKICSL